MPEVIIFTISLLTVNLKSRETRTIETDVRFGESNLIRRLISEIKNAAETLFDIQ